MVYTLTLTLTLTQDTKSECYLILFLKSKILQKCIWQKGLSSKNKNFPELRFFVLNSIEIFSRRFMKWNATIIVAFLFLDTLYKTLTKNTIKNFKRFVWSKNKQDLIKTFKSKRENVRICKILARFSTVFTLGNRFFSRKTPSKKAEI